MLNLVHRPPLSFVSPYYIIAFAHLTVGSLCTCNHWGLLLMWCCSTCRDWMCLYMSCQQESTLGSCTGLCWSFIILQKFLWRWIEYFSHCSPLSFQDFRKIHLSWEKSCFPCAVSLVVNLTPCSIQQWWSEHVGLGYFRKYIAWVSFYVSAITVSDWSLWHCFFMWSYFVCAQFLGCHEQTDGRLNHFVPQ